MKRNKVFALLASLFLFSTSIFSQEGSDQVVSPANGVDEAAELSATEKQELEDLRTEIEKMADQMDQLADKKVKFGLSIGYRKLFSDQTFDYQSFSIDPGTNNLQLEPLNDDAFVLSTSVMVYPFLNNRWLKEQVTVNHTLRANYQREWIDNLEEIKKLKIELRESTREELVKEERKRRKRKIRSLSFKQERFGRFLKKGLLSLIQNVGFSANVDIAEFNRSQNEFLFNKNLEGGLGFSLRLNDNIHISYNNDLLFSRQLRDHIKARAGQPLEIDGQVITDNSELDPEDRNIFITKTVIARATRLVITF